jgi:hypothetical protein
MEFEEYYLEVWNTMPESIVSDEYFRKNEELFDAITYEFYQYNEMSGSFKPYLASVAIQKVFGSMLAYGIR